jgi:hypothetical protein
MWPSALMAVAAGTILVLGMVHLLYTFAGDRLHPRDARLQRRMQQVALRLTPDTSVWRAWVGFNASHSLGAILFGLLYGYLALARPALLFGDAFLLSLAAVLLATLTWLAWRYWFRVPFAGIALAFACCVASILLVALGG